MSKNITHEERKQSLRHYWRMRKWAKGQPENKWPSMGQMRDIINEAWDGGYCLLCKNYGRYCNMCPLILNGYGCNNTGSLWRKMLTSKTWTEWIKNATEMARVIMRLPGKD